MSTHFTNDQPPPGRPLRLGPDEDRHPQVPDDMPAGGTTPGYIICALGIALLSPLNEPALLVCYSLLAWLFGDSFPDKNFPLLYALSGVAQVGLFTLMWLALWFAARRWSPRGRLALLVTLAAAFLLFWLGVTAYIYAEMAGTGGWI